MFCNLIMHHTGKDTHLALGLCEATNNRQRHARMQPRGMRLVRACKPRTR
jgi:hypothetical protein